MGLSDLSGIMNTKQIRMNIYDAFTNIVLYTCWDVCRSFIWTFHSEVVSIDMRQSSGCMDGCSYINRWNDKWNTRRRMMQTNTHIHPRGVRQLVGIRENDSRDRGQEKICFFFFFVHRAIMKMFSFLQLHAQKSTGKTECKMNLILYHIHV